MGIPGSGYRYKIIILTHTSCDQHNTSCDPLPYSIAKYGDVDLGVFRFLFLLILLRSYVQASRDSLIQDYFRQGYSHQLFLYFIHGISLSLRQLKRILRRLGLRRRPPAMNRRDKQPQGYE